MEGLGSCNLILVYYTLMFLLVPGFLLQQLIPKKSILFSGVYSKLGLTLDLHGQGNLLRSLMIRIAKATIRIIDGITCSRSPCTHQGGS